MAKIVALKTENYHANIGNTWKDDVIKEIRKELKKVTLEVQNKFLRKFIISLFPKIVLCFHIANMIKIEFLVFVIAHVKHYIFLYIYTARRS